MRKKRDQSMPPPGPPKTVIAIGIGPKKPGEEPPDDMPKDKTDDMPPDADAPPMGAAGGAPGDEEGEEKASPDKAIVIRADAHCKNCENYEPTTGECHEVEGVFDPDDACHAFYEGMGEEPDADDMGGAPDADADDQKAAMTQ